jgi:hypothetical protein
VAVCAERIEAVHCLVLVRVGKQMAVGVDRGLDRGVPEPATHYVKVVEDGKVGVGDAIEVMSRGE